MAALTIAACSKTEPKNGEELPPQEGGLIHMTFSASNTKTVLDADDNVLWEGNEHISIFDGSGNRDFYTEESGASAIFSGEAEAALTYYALYPYTSSAELNDGEISIRTSHYQSGVNGSFGSGDNLSAARTTGNSFTMKNIGGLIAFTLTSSDITSVTLRGNNNEWLTGDATISFDESGIPSIASTGQRLQYGSILLTPSSGDTFAPGTYYIFVPPTRFRYGVNFVFARSADLKTAEKNVPVDFTVARAGIAELGPVDGGLSWQMAIRLVFADHKTRTISMGWPFSEAQPANTTAWAGQVKTLTHDETGYTFEVYGKDYLYVAGTSGQGFKFGRSTDDYLQFPVIPGYGLKSVTLVSGNYNGSNVATMSLMNASTSTQVGDSWTNQTSGAVNTWNVNDVAGEIFRLVHDDTRYCSIQRLNLYYQPLEGATVQSVTTGEASNLYSSAGTSATLNGSFTTSSPAISAFTCGFDYKKDTDDWTTVTCSSPALSFSYDVTGLTKNAEYTFRAWCQGSSDESKTYGEEVTFTPSNTMVIDLNFDVSTGGGNIFGLTVNSDSGDKLHYKSVEYGGYTYELQSYWDSGEGIRHRTSSGYSGLCLSRSQAKGEDPVYSWIKLPAINSFKLSSIVVKTMDNPSSFNVSSSVNATTGVGNEDKLALKTHNSVRKDGTYSLTDPAAGESYYLCSPTAQICYMRIKLTYTYVDSE